MHLLLYILGRNKQTTLLPSTQGKTIRRLQSSRILHHWRLYLPYQGGIVIIGLQQNHYALLPLALSLVKLSGADELSDYPVHLSGLATGDIKTSSWILVFRRGSSLNLHDPYKDRVGSRLGIKAGTS